jgi:hypothetical protein
VLTEGLGISTAWQAGAAWSRGQHYSGGSGAGTDALALAAYLSLWVRLIALVRVRVTRFHQSMWLDGLITALGTTALGVAFLLGPYLSGRADAAPLPLVQLALPATDLLLLALLVALGSVLGLRLDRTAVLLAAAPTCVLAVHLQPQVAFADGRVWTWRRWCGGTTRP